MSSLRQQATSPTSPAARNVYSRASVDVESGEMHGNGHKRPYTPGASPRGEEFGKIKNKKFSKILGWKFFFNKKNIFDSKKKSNVFYS